MCGIIGYIGHRKPLPILLDGLKRLEYRGYDSAGVVVVNNNKVFIKKSVGRIKNLEEITANSSPLGTTGVGHNRWATHGKPTITNAHPHSSCDKKIHLVHNGIVENYKELRTWLIKKNHKFKSQTDTEVIVHLIEEFYKKHDFEKSVKLALSKINGTYALAITNIDNPNTLIVAKNSSPLLIGLGDQEYIIASDASAIMAHTNKVIYLNDKEMGVLKPSGYYIESISGKRLNKKPEILENSINSIKKGGYPHFLLKEIFEEPEAVENAIRGRLILQDGAVKLGGLEQVEKKLREINRLIVTACGTARYASLTGEYMLEEYAGIPTEVEYGSEFRYKKPVLDKLTAFFAVSQSGETADTLAAIREAERKKLLTLGIVNVVDSSIARETHAGIYNHAGPEISVASTKAFVSQLTIFVLLTLFMGRQRNMSLVMGKRIIKELQEIPKKMRKILSQAGHIKKIAKDYSKYNNFQYLGRKYNYPIALEGALKLKECSYVHAEGYGAGEMKHGSIALIDKNFPSFFIAPSDSVYDKVASSMEEVKARQGKIIAIATQGNKKITELADDVIYVPKTLEMLTPLLTVVPLHLFAYYVAAFRGCDIDKPRNLAKSVTVE